MGGMQCSVRRQLWTFDRFHCPLYLPQPSTIMQILMSDSDCTKQRNTICAMEFNWADHDPKLGSFKSHFFASYKGGTGTTTVLFHAAAQYARDNPSENVLIVDCSTKGDISERFLGGIADKGGITAGQEFIDSLYAQGKSIEHLFEYLNDRMSRDLDGESGKKCSFSLFSRNIAVAPVDDGSSSCSSESRASLQDPMPNIVEDFGVQVRRINSNIDLSNLYLIPASPAKARHGKYSSGSIFSNPDITNIHVLAKNLRSSMLEIPGVWRVFFDTNGVLGESSILEVVVHASDSCVIFTEADAADFGKVDEFIHDLHRIRKSIKSGERDCCRIAAVCFNKVMWNVAQQPIGNMNDLVLPHLIAIRSLVRSYAIKFYISRVFKKDCGHVGLQLFTSMMPRRASAKSCEPSEIAAFLASSFVIMRDFINVGVLANDVGVPICCIKAGQTYHGEHGKYIVHNVALLEALKGNVRELNNKL